MKRQTAKTTSKTLRKNSFPFDFCCCCIIILSSRRKVKLKHLKHLFPSVEQGACYLEIVKHFWNGPLKCENDHASFYFVCMLMFADALTL